MIEMVMKDNLNSLLKGVGSVGMMGRTYIKILYRVMFSFLEINRLYCNISKGGDTRNLTDRKRGIILSEYMTRVMFSCLEAEMKVINIYSKFQSLKYIEKVR
jgi:hypothetical protein